MMMIIKTLPEAQRNQGIEFITQIIFMTEINLISAYLKEKKGISDSNMFNQSHSKFYFSVYVLESEFGARIIYQL